MKSDHLLRTSQPVVSGTKTTPPMKGLIVRVYKTDLGDATNGGPSSKFSSFTLIDPMIEGPFEPSDNIPELVLVRRQLGGSEYIHAVPASLAGKQTMFGGNFIYTSDSRFSVVSKYPIPVHDRIEQ